VVLEATDQSKLSAAAMAATLSKGVSVGIGASFGLLYAQNKVIANIGSDSENAQGVTVKAKALRVSAEKKTVDLSNYSVPFKSSDLFTVNGGTNKGLIDITKKTTGSAISYDVTTNITTSDIVNAAQLTSLLASVNYYASAIAGTVVGSGSSSSTGGSSSQGTTLALAGAIAMLFNTSVTQATLGNNVSVELTDGDLEVTA